MKKEKVLIEVYKSNEDLSKLSEKEKLKYINSLFVSEYVGMEIPILRKGKELKAIINATTRKNIRAYRHINGKQESIKEYNSKLDLAYSGYLIKAISYATYERNKKENKVNQNKNHTEFTVWHYYTKLIIFNNILFELVLDIKELDKKLYVHNVKLKEATSTAVTPS